MNTEHASPETLREISFDEAKVIVNDPLNVVCSFDGGLHDGKLAYPLVNEDENGEMHIEVNIDPDTNNYFNGTFRYFISSTGSLVIKKGKQTQKLVFYTKRSVTH